MQNLPDKLGTLPSHGIRISSSVRYASINKDYQVRSIKTTDQSRSAKKRIVIHNRITQKEVEPPKHLMSHLRYLQRFRNSSDVFTKIKKTKKITIVARLAAPDSRRLSETTEFK